jgi:REP element-mobilizing transposase RayT
MDQKYKHKHLVRLSRIWIDNPVYMINTCTRNRRKILANKECHNILCEEWQNALDMHGWQIGHYIVMPDHVHFFASPTYNAKSLSDFMCKWKEWTTKKILNKLGDFKFESNKLWQKEFFDYLIRSEDKYYEKCMYIYNNPIRAGLVNKDEKWPYCGHIHFPE